MGSGPGVTSHEALGQLTFWASNSEAMVIKPYPNSPSPGQTEIAQRASDSIFQGGSGTLVLGSLLQKASRQSAILGVSSPGALCRVPTSAGVVQTKALSATKAQTG